MARTHHESFHEFLDREFIHTVTAFVEVLLNLPDSVADRVERVTAATKDNVTLVLDGVGQRVVWGSAEQSELKARVLARLMENQGSKARVEFDVTAPLNVVVRPL